MSGNDNKLLISYLINTESYHMYGEMKEVSIEQHLVKAEKLKPLHKYDAPVFKKRN
jgi:hypothetical protein